MTDWQLLAALDEFESTLCACGNPLAVCRNGSHRWQVLADVCGPSAALAAFDRKHKPEDRPDGLMLGVRLLGDDEQSVDPLDALTRDDMADLAARYPGEFSGGASSERSSEPSGDAPEAEHGEPGGLGDRAQHQEHGA